MKHAAAVSFLFTVIAVACSENSDEADFSDPKTPAAAGVSATTAGNSSVAGATSGGTTNVGGTAIEGGAADGDGGALVGDGGRASAGAGNNSLGGEGGSGPTVDPRPACKDAELVELSDIRLVEGAGPGETATLTIDVTNNTPDFVSHNALTFDCAGDVVESAFDDLTVFGTVPGDTIVVDLLVTIEDAAQPGQTAVCTARGSTNESPEDCANANVRTFVVTVE